ncbi:MAG: 1-acyl-sn-glycerol-3-phosphate acyltransferase [Hyphomonadaceae bacterium]|nr:1-acyl-sn-glycerol-3-phosphate acyltransferase [Hyphomonadaceae bacterium]
MSESVLVGGAGVRARVAKHIVDVLIEERAPRLSRTPAWPLMRPALYGILNYSKAVRMADTVAPLAGAAALEHISSLLRLNVEATGLERAPRDGAFLVVANHPTGITDGIALHDAMRGPRPDHMFYANSDAHRVCARFDDVLIPVEWVLAKRTRERTRLTLKMTGAAVEAGRPIVVFPAGRLARVRPGRNGERGRLLDGEWMATAASLARKYNIPLLPCHVTGPWAFWFHLFDKFSKELRDMTLFHELLNKQGRTYRLKFGPLIPAEALHADAGVATRKVKHYVESVLAHDGDAAFDPDGPECAWRDPVPGFTQG